jgi:hypothetical protein
VNKRAAHIRRHCAILRALPHFVTAVIVAAVLADLGLAK